MANRNLVCWNAMILGHCIHGNPKDGLNLYREMVGRMKSKDGETIPAKGSSRPDDDGGGIIPDEITFIGVLCACARAGLEAEEIIKNMPEIAEDLSSESLAWANLLGSCRFQGAMTTDTQANKRVNARHGLSQSSRVIPPSNEMGNAQMKIVFL
ncbi:hypothetical protein GBA52_025730 [Prunus armeniaca]|nr:hypothetical protein GBA52_025730 [Prunus armeniaca]